MDRSNRYLLAARLVAAIHLIFTLFALFGGILVSFAKWVAWIHIPVAIWGTYAFLAAKTCPLTPLEKRLRQKAGEEITEDGFVEGFMPFLKKWIESPPPERVFDRGPVFSLEYYRLSFSLESLFYI